MKFRIGTVVDFGTLVPTQAELAYHEPPLENWAVEAFNDILSLAQGALLRQRLDTEMERDVLPSPMYEAIVKSIDLRLAVVKQIQENVYARQVAERD